MAERLLSMQEARGSIPRFSNLFFASSKNFFSSPPLIYLKCVHFIQTSNNVKELLSLYLTSFELLQVYLKKVATDDLNTYTLGGVNKSFSVCLQESSLCISLTC